MFNFNFTSCLTFVIYSSLKVFCSIFIFLWLTDVLVIFRVVHHRGGGPNNPRCAGSRKNGPNLLSPRQRHAGVHPVQPGGLLSSSGRRIWQPSLHSRQRGRRRFLAHHLLAPQSSHENGPPDLP